MKCMFCGSMESKVIDSRPTDEGSSIRRRRECVGCGKRFTTYETSEELPVMVVKRDGRREGYDREKVLAGVRKACEKRPVPASAIDALVQDVSRDVFNTLLQEIPSTQIGEMVMAHLKSLDEVAYVRFASVYRQFKDINSFMDALKNMLGDTSK